MTSTGTKFGTSALAFAAIVACSSSRFTSHDAGGEGGTGGAAMGGNAGAASGGGSSESGGASSTGGGSSKGGTAGSSNAGGTAAGGGAGANAGGNAGSGASGANGGSGTGGASGASGTGNGGRAGSGGTGVGGHSGGGNAGAGGQGAGGSAACTPACTNERMCCNGVCANLQNDPLNCGMCGHKCVTEGYCGDGKCTTPVCGTTCSSGTCCGPSCCTGQQICCESQGPVSRAPYCTLPNEQGSCPPGCAPACVCASPDTRLATPQGERRIADIAAGDLVYSVDHGAVVAVPVVALRRMPVSSHRVVRLELGSGVVLEISALHPTADGRLFGDLHAGDYLDGVAIRSASMVPYRHDATYDILPASDTGAYFAGGVLIGSTLAVDPRLVPEPTTPLSAE